MGIEIIMTTAFLLPVAAATRALARTAIARSGTLLAHCQDVMSASVLFNCCTQTGQSESGACAQSAPTQPPNRSYSPRHARDGARAAETPGQVADTGIRRHHADRIPGRRHDISQW